MLLLALFKERFEMADILPEYFNAFAHSLKVRFGTGPTAYVFAIGALWERE